MTAMTTRFFHTTPQGGAGAALGGRDSNVGNDGMTAGSRFFLSLCVRACVTDKDCCHAVISSGSRLIGGLLTCDGGAVTVNGLAVINRGGARRG